MCACLSTIGVLGAATSRLCLRLCCKPSSLRCPSPAWSAEKEKVPSPGPTTLLRVWVYMVHSPPARCVLASVSERGVLGSVPRKLAERVLKSSKSAVLTAEFRFLLTTGRASRELPPLFPIQMPSDFMTDLQPGLNLPVAAGVINQTGSPSYRGVGLRTTAESTENHKDSHEAASELVQTDPSFENTLGAALTGVPNSRSLLEA